MIIPLRKLEEMNLPTLEVGKLAFYNEQRIARLLTSEYTLKLEAYFSKFIETLDKHGDVRCISCGEQAIEPSSGHTYRFVQPPNTVQVGRNGSICCSTCKWPGHYQHKIRISTEHTLTLPLLLFYHPNEVRKIQSRILTSNSVTKISTPEF